MTRAVRAPAQKKVAGGKDHTHRMGGCCAKMPVLTLPEDDAPPHASAQAPRRPPLPPDQFSPPRRGRRSCAPARVTANQYQPLSESTPHAVAEYHAPLHAGAAAAAQDVL